MDKTPVFSDTMLKFQANVMIPRRNSFHFTRERKLKEILAFRKYDRMEVTTNDRLSAAPHRGALENAWPLFYASPQECAILSLAFFLSLKLALRGPYIEPTDNNSP